jgi:hypothetical protein
VQLSGQVSGQLLNYQENTSHIVMKAIQDPLVLKNSSLAQRGEFDARIGSALLKPSKPTNHQANWQQVVKEKGFYPKVLEDAGAKAQQNWQGKDFPAAVAIIKRAPSVRLLVVALLNQCPVADLPQLCCRATRSISELTIE